MISGHRSVFVIGVEVIVLLELVVVVVLSHPDSHRLRRCSSSLIHLFTQAAFAAATLLSDLRVC